MRSSQKQHRYLTNTFPFGSYKPSAATDKLGEKQERKLKAFQLINRYGTLYSSNTNYEIVDFLGEGTFGRVMKCVEEGTRKMVAVKAMKARHSVKYYINERDTLQRLNEDDPEKFHIIRLLDSFSLRRQRFLVFELLEQSLIDFLEAPLPLPCSLHIINQVLSAMVKLKELRIVHTDIKPENIAFVDNKKKPLYIKLIDFNSAIQLPITFFSRSVQPLFYRAPEVILGLPYDEGIDMWSAGCVFAEMLTGSPLYPALTGYEAMKFIYDSHGMLPDHMLNCSNYAKGYFRKEHIARENTEETETRWKLKTANEYEDETGMEFSDYRNYVITDLSQVFRINASLTSENTELILEENKVIQCTFLLRLMLDVDQNTRISPEIALDNSIVSEFHNIPEEVKRFTCDQVRNMKLRASNEVPETDFLSVYATDTFFTCL